MQIKIKLHDSYITSFSSVVFTPVFSKLQTKNISKISHLLVTHLVLNSQLSAALLAFKHAQQSRSVS